MDSALTIPQRFAAVPAELQQLPHWVCWRFEQRDGKRTKVPYDVRRRRKASATNPVTWHSFVEARSALEGRAAYDGIGYVFTTDDPYCGIDLDQCLDAHGSFLWGEALVRWLDSYAEVSPSARGVKLIVRGRKPPAARCGKKGVEAGQGRIEIYDRARFFAVTGNLLPGAPPQIAERHRELLALCEHLWPQRSATALASSPAGPLPDASQVERRALAYLSSLPPAISGQHGHSATYAAATALVHGFGIPPERSLALLQEHYNPRCEPPWSLAELEHKVRDAASKPHDRPFRWLLDAQRPADPQQSVDISDLLAKMLPAGAAAEMLEEPPPDPGPIPERLLVVPGFVADVMDFTLQTAPHPNPPLAFAGALALQAVLAGRKVCEPGNLRTNLQILALAHSGVGKDWPRKVNARILLECGEQRKLGGKSASGEGIEDRLRQHPVVLKQDDEVDTLFENIRDNTEARYRNQLATLLELYGEAGGWRAVRDKADRESQIIHQPHLVLLGTTTPSAFYESLSSKMLLKGLIARLTMIEAGPRGRRKRPTWPPLPDSILEVARWWSRFQPPGWGNLCDESVGAPTPHVVKLDESAGAALESFADECDEHYAQAQNLGDEPAMAIWARGVERATQLVLVYACSANHQSPQITEAAAAWATALVRHGILRTLFMLGQHFHESPFEANCNAVWAALVAWGKEHGSQAWMPHRILRKRLKRLDARQFEEAWRANEEVGRVEYQVDVTGGRPTRSYRAMVTRS